jgi:hypothetical protein
MSKSNIPKDAQGAAFHRAMGVPRCSRTKILGSATKFIDIFDLTGDRVYTGISIQNPSTTARILIAIGEEFDEEVCIDVPPLGLYAFDNQSFGGMYDASSGLARQDKVRAKLDTLVGVLASGTIAYVNNPSDGQTVVINGRTYEFSSDSSAQSGRIYVPIGVSANDSFDNLADKIEDNDQALSAAASAGTLTLTSNLGGTDGNAITMVNGSLVGATFSGGTLAGGSGGVTPIIHIW